MKKSNRPTDWARLFSLAVIVIVASVTGNVAVLATAPQLLQQSELSEATLGE